MKKFSIIAVLLCATVAGAFELKQLPEKTKWLMRIDVKNCREAKVLKKAAEGIFPRNHSGITTKIDSIKVFYGVDLIEDIDEVLIGGEKRLDSPDYIYMRGRFDEGSIAKALNQVKSFKQQQHGSTKVYSWKTGKEGVRYLSFPVKNVVVTTKDFGKMETAIDTLRGDAPGMVKATDFKSVLKEGEARLFSARAENPSSLVEPKTFWDCMGQVKIISMFVDTKKEKKVRLSSAVRLDAVDTGTAQKIKQSLVGIQSLAMLRQKDSPEQAALASIANITHKDAHVDIVFPMETYMCTSLVRMVQVARLKQLHAADDEREETYKKQESAAKRRLNKRRQ